MSKLFKNRSYFLLFQGNLVSLIGTMIYSFAAGIYVLSLFPIEQYGNIGALYFALISASPIITKLIISPLSGALVDKWNKIRIIYITDIINGTVFLFSLFILINGNYSIYQKVILFIVVGGIAGINSAFFSPAVQSSIPDIVGEDMIQTAYGAQQVIYSVQGIVGVLIGVILYETLGIEIAILVNAISFFISGLSEMFIRVSTMNRQVPEKHIWDDIKSGFRYIRRKNGLLNMMKYSVLMNFAFAPIFGVGIPFLFKTELGKNGYHLAATSIIFSISMMISAIYVGSRKQVGVKSSIVSDVPRLGLAIALLVGSIFAVTYGLIDYWVFFSVYIIVTIIMTYYMNSVNIPLNTALVRGINPDFRGRVLSILGSLSSSTTPVAIIVGGVIIQYSNTAFLGLISLFLIIYPLYGFSKDRKVLSFYDDLDIQETQQLELQTAA